MILRGILDHYATDQALQKRARPGTGLPTGSSFGKCTAQMQMLRHPELSNPEPTRARGVMTFENGDLVEAWWRKKVSAAFPGMIGLAQEPFYFSVPVLGEEADVIAGKMELRYGEPGALWGRAIEGFQPPSIRWEKGEPKPRLRLMPCGPRCQGLEHGPGCGKKAGFVLDRSAGILWCPTYIDNAMLHPEWGPTIIEYKAMSNFQFRRALLGDIDLGKRCQLAGIADATGLNVVWLLYRKDTAHLLEMAFVRQTIGGVPLTRPRVRILKSNGQEENYFVAEGRGMLIQMNGLPTPIPHDLEWEVGEIWTPWGDDLLEQIRARIKRVVLFNPSTDPDPTQWHREYGPNFLCEKCQGSGQIQCAYCAGTGASLRSKPAGKPCGGCAATGVKVCPDCEGQPMKMEAKLPQFPCGYCAVVKHCYGSIGGRLEISDKPTWLIGREDFKRSGVTVHSPDGAAALEEVEP